MGNSSNELYYNPFYHCPTFSKRLEKFMKSNSIDLFQIPDNDLTELHKIFYRFKDSRKRMTLAKYQEEFGIDTDLQNDGSVLYVLSYDGLFIEVSKTPNGRMEKYWTTWGMGDIESTDLFKVELELWFQYAAMNNSNIDLVHHLQMLGLKNVEGYKLKGEI